MNIQTITGTYGSNETETEIYVYTGSNGLNWYVCEDSVNVNATYEDLQDGVNVELVEDSDTSTAQSPICSEEDLERFMDGGVGGFEYVIESWTNGQKKQAIQHIDDCGGLYEFINETSANIHDALMIKIVAYYALENGL
jgi:hypothetical protein